MKGCGAIEDDGRCGEYSEYSNEIILCESCQKKDCQERVKGNVPLSHDTLLSVPDNQSPQNINLLKESIPSADTHSHPEEIYYSRSCEACNSPQTNVEIEALGRHSLQGTRQSTSCRAGSNPVDTDTHRPASSPAQSGERSHESGTTGAGENILASIEFPCRICGKESKEDDSFHLKDDINLCSLSCICEWSERLNDSLKRMEIPSKRGKLKQDALKQAKSEMLDAVKHDIRQGCGEHTEIEYDDKDEKWDGEYECNKQHLCESCKINLRKLAKMREEINK